MPKTTKTSAGKLVWYGEDILKQIREATPDGLFAAGEELIDTAAARAPIGATGDLAKSGYVSMEGKSTYRKQKNYRKEVKPAKGGVNAGFAVFYARFVEYGTKHVGAKPFLRPALDELNTKLGDKVAGEIRKKLK